MAYHTTSNGDKIPIVKLENGHLRNIILLIRKRAKEGMDVMHGSYGMTAEEMWCDVDTIYGNDVYDHMEYDMYFNEWKRRGFKDEHLYKTLKKL